jgi:hypothetical protein
MNIVTKQKYIKNFSCLNKFQMSKTQKEKGGVICNKILLFMERENVYIQIIAFCELSWQENKENNYHLLIDHLQPGYVVSTFLFWQKWMRSSQVVRMSDWLLMLKSQQSRVQSQLPSSQWTLRAADEVVLNKVHQKSSLKTVVKKKDSQRCCKTLLRCNSQC